MRERINFWFCYLMTYQRSLRPRPIYVFSRDRNLRQTLYRFGGLQRWYDIRQSYVKIRKANQPASQGLYT